jgi:hypothetical protein
MVFALGPRQQRRVGLAEQRDLQTGAVIGDGVGERVVVYCGKAGERPGVLAVVPLDDRGVRRVRAFADRAVDVHAAGQAVRAGTLDNGLGVKPLVGVNGEGASRLQGRDPVSLFIEPLKLGLTDDGPGQISSDANSDSVVIGSDGQDDDPMFSSITGTIFNGGDFTLTDGGSQTAVWCSNCLPT